MIIKVCGMRESSNIRDVSALDIDWMGMIFYPKSPRYVINNVEKNDKIKRVGVFVNDSPQSIITHVVNFRLDIIQFHGNETPIMIRNIRRTIDPDIHKDIKIIKAISITTAEDIMKYKAYEDDVDYFLFDTKCKTVGGSGEQFDWDILQQYDGNKPFLLSGGIGPDDVQRIKQFKHPRLVGIDINSRFETSPGIKDVSLLKQFITQLKN